MAKKTRIGQVVGLVVGLTSEDTTAALIILDRLKQAANANSDTELASTLGLKYSSISSAKSRGMVPTAWIINAANLFNVSADWLIFGDESKRPSNNYPNEIKPSCIHNIQIPFVEAELSAGGGSFLDSKVITRHIEISPDIIKYKGSMKDMVFMSVYGDSMEPTIAHKDLVLINLSQTIPYSGGVFAVAHDWGIYIKRLTTEPGKLILRSDNKFYEDIVIDLKNEAAMSLVKIIGRAIWWCHDERL